MRRILMRSGMTPFNRFTPSRVIIDNSIGGNSGNLVYAFSVYRALMTEDTRITSTFYKLDFTDCEIEEINETFDAFVVPLADAFRDSFAGSLKKLASIIRKLKIPCVVIGVGLRAPFEPDLDKGFAFDDAVKDFMDAVLEKSAIVGVRGQITSDYLTKLGYIDGKHHMVIGCPSMYAFGRDLNIRDTKITKDSLVCMNNSAISPKNVLDFLERSRKEFSNLYFIPQRLNELKLTYFGIPNPTDINKPNYPHSIDHSLYKEDRVRFFINFREWNRFLSKADFSFGARMHGNIASVISGAPSIIIPKDARMRELSEYHNLTRVNSNEIKKDTSIWDLIEKADFKAPLKNQHKNFDNYRNFLNINGLDNIFRDSDNPINTRFDRKLEKADLQPCVTTYNLCSEEERISRTGQFARYSDSAVKKLKEQIKEQNKLIKEQNNILNKRSVKTALKLSEKLSKFRSEK